MTWADGLWKCSREPWQGGEVKAGDFRVAKSWRLPLP